MRAIILDDFGGPEVLHLADMPEPIARDGDLIVQVRAAGVNRADLNQRRGVYGREDFGDSTIMGLEIAGEVIQSTSPDFLPGARVMGIVGGGGYAEFARMPAAMAMRIPDKISYVEAASIPECFITAHEVLLHLAGLRKDDVVLIHGAAGGVGLAAVALSSSAGARVLFTAREEVFSAVEAYGGQMGFDYRVTFAEKVLAATNGRGVDIILDIVGARNLDANLAMLADGGRLLQVGLLGGRQPAALPLDQLLFRRLQIIGSVMKSQTKDAKIAMTNRFSERWLVSFANGKLAPLPANVVPLRDAGKAHIEMEKGGHVGKWILVP